MKSDTVNFRWIKLDKNVPPNSPTFIESYSIKFAKFHWIKLEIICR